MIRAFYSVIRNPLDVGYKIIQAILTAIVAAIIFGKVNIQLNLDGWLVITKCERSKFFFCYN